MAPFWYSYGTRTSVSMSTGRGGESVCVTQRENEKSWRRQAVEKRKGPDNSVGWRQQSQQPRASADRSRSAGDKSPSDGRPTTAKTGEQCLEPRIKMYR